MNEDFDFVVIGSGGGSMTAALVMRALGKSVLILEKSEKVGGTTARSGGVMWIPNNRFMAEAGTVDSEEAANAYLDAIIGDDPSARGATVARRRAYVREAPKMLEFLLTQGLKFRRIPLYPDFHSEAPGSCSTSRTVVAQLFDSSELGTWKAKLEPTFLPYPANLDDMMQLPWFKRSWKSRWLLTKMIRRVVAGKITGRTLVSGGNSLQGRMLQAILKAGADVRLGMPVTDILVEDGRAVGVTVTRDGAATTIRARLGVLINAGGFARNQAMRDRYLPGTSTGWTNVVPGDTGEMIETALGLGATVAQTDAMVGALVAIPPSPGPIVPMLQGDAAKPHAIIVDDRGRRFVKEAGSYVDLCYGLTAHIQARPGVRAWLVVDAQFAEKYNFMGSKGTKMRAGTVESGFVKTGETLEALAAECGIDAAALRATVDRFNAFALTGKDLDFGRGGDVFQETQGDPWHRPSHVLGTLERGPYFAVEVHPGDVSTYGGLVTDEHARVLREDGTPIAGLYATGTSTASAMGRREPGPGGSVGPSMLFGYLAARHAAHADNQIT
jgi:3-oxosteroid 1-dehydrogenase